MRGQPCGGIYAVDAKTDDGGFASGFLTGELLSGEETPKAPILIGCRKVQSSPVPGRLRVNVRA